IDRIMAYRILNEAAVATGLETKIGTHTLRKTFGFHLYQQKKDVALLQYLFNHSSPSVTLRYIGINQNVADEVMKGFNL
ncbi:MAG TPA: tyrosine-type recombinase/integrase, partial [bacterium]|nr:tyrosine-type recombinase/integrase [bacterium]